MAAKEDHYAQLLRTSDEEVISHRILRICVVNDTVNDDSGIHNNDRRTFDVYPTDTVDTIVEYFIHGAYLQDKMSKDSVAVLNEAGSCLHFDKSVREVGCKDGDILYITNKSPRSRTTLCLHRTRECLENCFCSSCETCDQMIVFAVLSVLVVLGLIAYLLTNSLTSLRMMHYVVIDAGAAHTNIDLYTWPNVKVNGTGLVEQVFSCEIPNLRGIATFVNDSAADSLLDYLNTGNCLSDIISHIPASDLSETPFFLGATGGMRMLNATDPVASENIMTRVSSALARLINRNNATEKNKCAILSGEDEGKFGWISVNYLMGTFLHGDSLYGALDWGGASAQITFPVDSNPQTKVTFFNVSTDIFTTSHLCYGQATALDRYFTHLIYEEFVTSGDRRHLIFRLNSPCQPRGANNDYVVSAEEIFNRCTQREDPDFNDLVGALPGNTTFHFHGTNQRSVCDKIIHDQLNFDVCMTTYGHHSLCFDSSSIPRPKHGTIFLAFSTYWYLMTFMNLTGENGTTQVTTVKRSNFFDAMNDLCSKSDDKNHPLHFLGAEIVHNTCFRSLFMYYLLVNGYGFQNWTNIVFVSKLRHESIGWTLGYMLEQTNHMEYLTPGNDAVKLRTIVYCSVALSASLLVYLGYKFVANYSKFDNGSPMDRVIEIWKDFWYV